MSNIFKSNSRFAALVETDAPQKKEKHDRDQKNDRDQKEKEKYCKDNEEPKFSSFRPLDENEKERRRLKREMEFQKQKEIAEAEKERIKSISLQINPTNFPELFLDSKQDNIISNGETYLEKLKHKEVTSNNDVDPDLVNLKPGWFILKRDNLTGKTIIKKKQAKNVVTKLVEVEAQAGFLADDGLVEERRVDEEVNIDITDELIKLHDKRTQEYIDSYGYEEWEKKFKVPNWREEEAYLEMMEQAFGVPDNLIDSDYEDENGSDYDYDC
jgi:hypothetical protein